METAGDLGMLYLYGTGNEDFAGIVNAQQVNYFYVTGHGLATSELHVSEQVGTVSFGGNFNGIGRFGSIIGTLSVGGQFGATGDVVINGDVGGILFGNGAAAGSTLFVHGYASYLIMGGQHNGTIAIDRGMGYASFNGVNSAYIVVGENITASSVTGGT